MHQEPTYQDRDVLSDGMAPFGEHLPYPLTARLSGQGNIVLLERVGTEYPKTFTLTLHEIEELIAWKQLKMEKLRYEREEAG